LEGVVSLAHGDGGLATRELLREVFLKYLDDPALRRLEDSARVDFPGPCLVLTTDAFVVSPLFFPGGDIGCLSVYGTVNDLCCLGADPLFLTASFVLEEGLRLADLERIVASMAQATRRVGVRLVAGDTKVVPRGMADGLYVTTSGVGHIPPGTDLRPERISPGDRILVSGTIGDHGVAVLAARHRLLEGEATLASDCGPVHRLAGAARRFAPGLKVMRDPTRGGLATVLKELAEAGRCDLLVEEEALPTDPAAAAVAELLGLDLLYLASEGKLVAVAAPEAADAILQAWRQLPEGQRASCVGEVREGSGRVLLKTALGGTRELHLVTGEPLPRIC